MAIRTWLVVLLIACAGDGTDTARAEAEVLAQRAPEKPRRLPPKKPDADQPPSESPALKDPAPKEPAPKEPAPKSCCKTCSKGKACGNSCISRRLACHKPPGCACDSGRS